MRRGLATTVVAGVLACWLGLPGDSRAQGLGIRWSEYDRQLAPGASVPYDGAPYSERYGFYAGPAFYFGIGVGWGYPNTRCVASEFDYIEYIDRVERAEKFGYRIPPPPRGWAPVWTKRQP
jgi:hypothetical protein